MHDHHTLTTCVQRSRYGFQFITPAFKFSDKLDEILPSEPNRPKQNKPGENLRDGDCDYGRQMIIY